MRNELACLPREREHKSVALQFLRNSPFLATSWGPPGYLGQSREMVSLSRLSPRFQIVPLVSNYTSTLHAGPITTDDELTAPSPAPLPQKNHILLGYFLVARNRTSFELVEARTRCTIAILRYRREFRSNF